MLTLERKVTLNGESRIDGLIAEGYRAEISSVNPEDMTITSWQVDRAVYKAVREICRADRAAFEEAAYEMQEQMLAENKAAEAPKEVE